MTRANAWLLVSCVAAGCIAPGRAGAPDASSSVDAAIAPRDAPIIVHSDGASPEPAVVDGPPLAQPPHAGASALLRGDGTSVFVASAETDMVYEVALDSMTVARTVVLAAGAEPDRMAEDARGRVHVVLRGSGQVATIEPGTSTARTREVCASPRGIAYRASDDALVVACADGTLLTLAAATLAVTSSITLDDDLRDVVIAGDRVLVSRFRSAEVLGVAPDGSVYQRWIGDTIELPDPLASTGTATQTLVPRVAWRLVPRSGGAWLLHQRHRTTPIPAALVASTPAYYGAPGAGRGPSAIIETVVMRIDALGTARDIDAPVPLPLATDLAIAADGSITVVMSSATGALATIGAVVLEWGTGTWRALGAGPIDGLRAVAVCPRGEVAFVRAEPLALVIAGRPVAVLDDRPGTAGRSLFSRLTASGLACASCHPEGGDDGHVWQFGVGPPVRTQSLFGGVIGTAPFHWEGDLHDFAALMDEVFVRRMGGDPTFGGYDAFARWLEGLPAPAPRSTDAAAISRGRALFDSSEVGCANCHSGPQHTSNATVDVGTGGMFQVPRLVGVGARAPYMHSGCAATLRDRFTGDPSCTGGDQHGHTSQLTSAQIDDLVAYLSSL